MQVPSAQPARRWPLYLGVFLVLILLTVIEIMVAGSGVTPPALNVILLALSFSKAGLVAAFYMHLRGDHRLYTAIFVLPVLLLMVFAVLSVLI
ncbi:MAG TPA: cytochrome C oxidase subunit IV family protein [Anaerolineales bacterium]|nr:cytochrome C oxidase subunit IV family protein [Anaerolineales bacterium]